MRPKPWAHPLDDTRTTSASTVIDDAAMASSGRPNRWLRRIGPIRLSLDVTTVRSLNSG